MAKTNNPSASAEREFTYPSATEFAVEAARAFAGALIFALPLLMTMEMWWLGFYMEPLRLALLLVLMVPLLVRLSRYSGIRRTASVWDDIADVLVAVAIAAAAAGLILWMFGIVTPEMPVREIVGKIAIQTFPGSLGAMLARSQFGSKTDEERDEEARQSYGGELFVMVAGALFLSLNVAPTEEMAAIALSMQVWQEIALLLLTLFLMHGFVYAFEFGGTHRPQQHETFWSLFARFTVVGYVLVLGVSLYVLWTFGRTDDMALPEIMSMAIVLSFPGALGAAAARLIL
jgi:putative integral membrane protein (TIGR02587 family)